MVGINPRRKKEWRKVVDDIRRRLVSWRGKFISIGGRVTLIKAVLNAILVFSFSFYKAPMVIINDIRRMLGNFLWSGCADKRGIH